MRSRTTRRHSIPLGGLTALAVALAVSACSDDRGTPDSGTTGDAGVTDGGDAGQDGGLRPDASPRDGGSADANELRDAATVDGGDPLQGTPLEGLAIEWASDLSLCTRWQEGRSVDVELATKAEVSIPAATRAGLTPDALASARIARISVRRGPFADRQWTTEPGAPALVDYGVIRHENGGGSLWAELEYDLGPAGVLVERYSIYRTPGDTTPVRVSDDSYEHAFALRGSAIEDASPLSTCEGDANLDDAVHVLVARSGGDHAVLTRYARTVEAEAGSAPMFLRALEVRFPEREVPPVMGSGYWFGTYAAEHHNFDDTSHFDFGLDLGQHEQLFEPWRDGEQVPVSEALELVDLRAIDAFGPTPEVDLTWRDFTNGMTRKETWSASPRWMRVDATFLADRLTCPGGQVLTLADWGVHTLQVLTCPSGQAPGFTVERIVPVHFAGEPDAIGQEQTQVRRVTVDGRPGFEVTVGGHVVSISKDSNDTWLFVRIAVAGGDVISDFLAESFPLWPAQRDEVLGFASAPAELDVTIVRRWVAQGVGESSIYAPVVMHVTHADQTWIVDAWDRLDYTNTHHNWMDELVADAGDATITWRTEFIPDRKDTIRIVAADGTELLPETEVMAK
ncbi:hypothetical protein L6R52_12875 [Myxococcota bacterium]|nr:hypothetical protein [Myxococcota bacterium]